MSLDLIQERLSITQEVTSELLASTRRLVEDRMVSIIRHEVATRFELGVNGGDVAIVEHADVEAKRRRESYDVHTFTATWHPSPRRGVLVEDREGIITLQTNLPHDLPMRLTVPQTNEAPLASRMEIREDRARIVQVWRQTVFAYAGIHRGSGLLVYREEP